MGVGRFRLGCLFVATLFFSLTTQAADRGLYQSYGLGNKSCGRFVAAKDGAQTSEIDESDRFAMLSWVQGYLTRYNVSSPDTYSITGNTDTDGIELWLYNYCKANPLLSISDGAEVLVLTLRPNRLIHAPKS